MLKALWLAWTVVVGVSSLLQMDGDPSEIMINSLTSEQLDEVLDARLDELQARLVKRYQEHLKDHKRSLQTLERHKRGLDGPRPTLGQDYWHAYTFNTVSARQVVKISSIVVKEVLGVVTITHVFPLHLKTLLAIYQSDVGLAYIIRNGRLEELKARNEWTASPSGCSCDITISQTCACCRPGGCLCRQSDGHPGNACVPCGQEHLSDTCTAASTSTVQFNAVTAFEYQLETDVETQTLVIISRGRTAYFYRYDTHGLQTVNAINGLSYIQFGNVITHLGFGEAFVDFYGTLKRRRFLISFTSGESTHHHHELTVGTRDHTIALGLSSSWSASGSSMETWHAGGRTIISVHNGIDLSLYEMKEGRWHTFQIVLLQKITLGNSITWWRSFTSGFEFYLIVVSRSLARIYILRSNYYEALQDLEPSHGLDTFEAIVPVTIPSCRDEFVLVTGVGNLLVTYVWNGASETLELGYTGTISRPVLNWSLGFGLHLKTQGALVVRGVGVMFSLVVTAYLESLQDPVHYHNQQLDSRITSLEEEYKRQNDVMNLARDRLDHRVVNGSALVMSSHITFSNIVVIGGLHVHQLVADNIGLLFTDLEGRSYPEYIDFLQQIRLFDARLRAISSNLNTIISTLDNAVPKSDTSQVIRGMTTIVNAGLNLLTLSSEDVSLGELLDFTGINVELLQVLQSLVRRTESRVITGKKTFTGEVVVQHLDTNFLDDIPVGDLVTTTGAGQVILGASFSSLSAATILLEAGGTVAGIDLSEEVVSLNSEATLSDLTFITDVWVRDLTILSGLLNGLDINRLLTNTLQVNGGTVLGSLIFRESVTVVDLDASILMGINTTNFMATTVFKDLDAELTGRLTVPSIEIRGDLIVLGNINGERFPQSFPLKTSSSLNFGNKNFLNVQLGSVTIGLDGTVDGIKVGNLIILNTEQVISGRKRFLQGVNVDGNLDITTAIIDGVNLDDLYANLPSVSALSNFRFNIIFKGTVYAPSLHFGGTLNGLNFDIIAADLIFSDEDSVFISGLVVFESTLTVTNVVFRSSFNGFTFDSLITPDRDQILRGEVNFLNTVTFKQLTVHGTIDGVDLNALLSDAVYLDRSGQLITGKKTFTNVVTVRDLEVTGRINGVDLSNLVTKTGDQTFTAAQTLSEVMLDSLNTNSIQLSSGFRVNGIDFSELASRRVRLNSPDNHFGTLTINGPLSVLGDLVPLSVNGQNLQELLDNLVTDHQSSTITGDVVFSNLIVDGSVTTNDQVGANGINISDLAANAVKLDGDNEFTGAATWGDLLLIGDVLVSGLINGINLVQLSQDAVYKDVADLQVITGKKTFENGFTVKGNIIAQTVNGKNLLTHLLTLDTDQIISGSYTFNHIVAPNIYLVGAFNDIDLKRLASGALTLTENQIDGVVVFHNTVMVRNVDFHGLVGGIGGINITAYLLDAIRLLDTGVVVTGTKTFTSITIIKDIDVQFLNGRLFDDFLDQLVMRFGIVNISSNMTVARRVIAPSVTVKNIFVDGTIDGVDYKSLLENALYLTGNQIISSTLVFTQSITVIGNIAAEYLNTLSILSDYLTTNTDQTFTHTATFGSISSSDVVVLGTVNSLYLPNELAVTLKASDGQVVTELKTLTGLVKVLGNVEVSGTTGIAVKVKLATQVIHVAETAQISGLLVFDGNVTVASLSSSTDIINGVFIRDLHLYAWYIDQVTIITARLRFEREVILQLGLITTNAVDSFVISEAYEVVSTIVAMFGNNTRELKTHYESVCTPVFSLYIQLEDAFYVADYLQRIDEGETPYRRHASTSFWAFNRTYIPISWEGGVCNSVLYSFDPISQEIIEVEILYGSGYAHEWLYLEGANEVYLAMAASPEGNDCDRTNSVIWKITENSIQVHQELVPGEHLAAKNLGGGVVDLFIHSLNQTLIYRLDPDSGIFHQIDNTTETIDISLTLYTSDGTSVMFMSRKGNGTIIVNGEAGQQLYFGTNVDDAVLFEQSGRVFLILAISQYKLSVYKYYLELCLVDIRLKTLIGLDWQTTQTTTSLTAFFAGSGVCGFTIIIAVQPTLYPLIYYVKGERLLLFTEECIPRVYFVQHIGIPSTRFPSLFDHYVLMGRNHNATLLTKLVMRGAAVPHNEDLYCKPQLFIDPVLFPAILTGS